jgi:hypothetical protein
MSKDPNAFWLRLSSEDAAILWGIVEGHMLKATQRWPRMDRIKFDLEVMLRQAEKTGEQK